MTKPKPMTDDDDDDDAESSAQELFNGIGFVQIRAWEGLHFKPQSFFQGFEVLFY